MFIKNQSKYNVGDTVYSNTVIKTEEGYFTKGTEFTITYVYSSNIHIYDIKDEYGNEAKGILEPSLSVVNHKDLNYFPYAIAILFIVSFIVGYLLT